MHKKYISMHFTTENIVPLIFLSLGAENDRLWTKNEIYTIRWSCFIYVYALGEINSYQQSSQSNYRMACSAFIVPYAR